MVPNLDRPLTNFLNCLLGSIIIKEIFVDPPGPLLLVPCCEKSYAGLMLIALEITILFLASVSAISFSTYDVKVLRNIIPFFLVKITLFGSFLGDYPLEGKSGWI